MRILVTGAAGFVGSHLVRRLAQLGYEVHALDALIDSTYSSQVKQRRWDFLRENVEAKYYVKDLRYDNLDSIVSSVDVIVNEAGLPGLMLSWNSFQLYSDCNLVAVSNLMETLKRHPKKRFVQISTSSVYGLNATGDETSETTPVSPYGVTKLSAEKLIQAYANHTQLDYIILRYYSIFGPGQRPDMGYSIFIDSILNKKEISIYGDGNQIRSNTYINDCIDGTILAIQQGVSGEIYNISGGEEVTVNQAIGVLAEISGITPVLKYLPKRPGDQLKTSGNWLKANQKFGYSPKIKFRNGLIEQFLSHQESRFF